MDNQSLKNWQSIIGHSTGRSYCVILAYEAAGDNFGHESFRDKEIERLFARHFSRRFPANLHRAAWSKLVILDAAERLDDLRIPPGNRLEKLTGDREGQYGIRINQQYRICFEWRAGDAYEVEITDYHQGRSDD